MKKRSSYLVAFLLIVLALPYAILHFWASTIGVDWQTGLAISSIRNAFNNGYYQKLFTYSITIEYTAAFFTFFIHYWAVWYKKRIRFTNSSQSSAKNKSLSVKFQVEETIRIARTLLPIVVVKCFLQTSSTILSYVANQIWISPPTDVQMIIYELVNLNHLQPLTTSLLMVYGSGQFGRVFGCCKKPLTHLIWLMIRKPTSKDLKTCLKNPEVSSL
uniref:G-protein coupled receptors family 1 profile domain-containing protein n=1 Tax=Ditylenchus dipsaci TaxID=166011 RepID=A0A915DB65_9BILA